MTAAKRYNCPFAIRGGGHSDVPGASNSPGGITLDLVALSSITVSADRTTASIGPGLRWGQVYTALDPMGLTVVGGREFPVGVAGLTLGGGISYFSGLYGLACDNVHNYEVVLADGRVLMANATGAHADLYKALRGGGNNFGVVTRFDLAAYPYSLMYGGLVAWKDSSATSTALISAFAQYATAASSDPKAALFLSLNNVNGTYLWTAGLEYTEVNPAPPIFAPFHTAQLNAVKLFDTEKPATHAALATELGATQPAGQRQQFHTATFEVDAALFTAMTQIFRSEVARVEAVGLKNPVGFTATFALQPLSTRTLALMGKSGGNVLGLVDTKKPLMILSMAWPWTSQADDALVVGAMQNIVDKSVATAKKMGLFNKYIYMNYAQPKDQVVATYGADNVRFLKQVSKKYDPDGVFQRLVPGGFKLPS